LEQEGNHNNQREKKQIDLETRSGVALVLVPAGADFDIVDVVTIALKLLTFRHR
jgi:hypothetical protein